MGQRSAHRSVACWPAAFAMFVCANCGGTAPTTPSVPTSFLSGTWNGNLTITRSGQPSVSGPTTWTFDVMSASNRQTFNLSLQSSNAWLPITATSVVTLAPSADPPGRIGGTGTYTSPRGCTGEFVLLADATASLIDGTFAGIDCDQGAGRVGFDGVMRLTKP